MDLKSVTEKELARYLMPLLKRNFLEWKSFKKKLSSGIVFKNIDRNEDRIEKILLSEPVANFFAYWLKVDDSEENNQNLRNKIAGYIKGLFSKELKDEEAIKIFLTKCIFIADLHHKATLKMIESALALQDLAGKENLSLKNIFENKKAFKIILRSSMKADEWRFSITVFLSWLARLEISEKDLPKFYRFSQEIVSKREKELFS
ncbi:MAG: hypothetical protein ACYC3G_01520 [Minisyncoccota bacterium]